MFRQELQPDPLLSCNVWEWRCFPEGELEALPPDPPKPGQRKHEVSCPDHKARLDPLPPGRRTVKSSHEHLKQPVALPTPASTSLPNLQQGQPSDRHPGSDVRHLRCNGSAAAWALTRFVFPLPFLLSLWLGNENAASLAVSRQSG